VTTSACAISSTFAASGSVVVSVASVEEFSTVESLVGAGSGVIVSTEESEGRDCSGEGSSVSIGDVVSGSDS